jgi:transposase InsO family protein
MSALVAATANDDVTEVRRLLNEGMSVNVLDILGRSAMSVAVLGSHASVVNWLTTEGDANINAVVTANGSEYTTLSLSTLLCDYPLAQWLIEEGALIPTQPNIKCGHGEYGGAAELILLLKVLDHTAPDVPGA